MSIRSLSLSLAIATSVAAAAVTLAHGAGAPAAGLSVNSVSQSLVLQSVDEAVLRRHGAAEACRSAVWPYIPSACLRNASPERQARSIRIIPIHEIAASR